MQEPQLTAIPEPLVVDEPPAQQPARPGVGSMIVFEAVTKVYEPDVVALADVSFHIDKGDFVFVVGASGSGKSTLVRLLLKELEPTSGKIVIGGRELGRLKT
ncbi:MAG: ATP-binding cassette domain-containing protein, partial [Gaiellaceae bacterium]